MSGIPELFVLRLLSESEMYGYEIVSAIRSETAEAVVLGEGVIYPLLHSLEKDGRLKSRKKRVAGRERIYYRATTSGASRLKELFDDWQRVSRSVGLVMKPSENT